MTKLSRISQGFRLRGKNCEELLAIRVLVVALVQALVALVQAHPPQGGLVCVVRKQIVVGTGFGLFGSVRSGFVTHRLCRGWGLSGVKQRGGPATLTLTLHQGWDSGWWCSDI